MLVQNAKQISWKQSQSVPSHNTTAYRLGWGQWHFFHGAHGAPPLFHQLDRLDHKKNYFSKFGHFPT